MKRFTILFSTLFLIVSQTLCFAQQEPSFKFPQQKAAYYCQQFKAKLDALADWCAENGLPEQEKITREWSTDFPEDRICLYEITTAYGWDALLPIKIEPGKEDSLKSKNVQKWRSQFIKLRTEYSDQLCSLAKKCAASKYATYAFELYMLALRENPQNEFIRKLIGNVPYENRWATQYEMRMSKAGKVDHPVFGWILQTQVERYENGERYYQGRWMSAADEARLHRDKNDPWIIVTPHYKIYSYPSLEQGVELSRKLENLAVIWNQLFLRFFATDAQLKRFYAGQNPEFMNVQHQVFFYRDKAQYVEKVSRIMRSSLVAGTLGVYYSDARMAPGTLGASFFFTGQDYDERTVLHETTHQLFAESRPRQKSPGAYKNVLSPGKNCNFWAIEGIATFMESLTDKPGRHELGDLNDERIFAARFRVLKSRFYIPFDQFTAMSMKEFQSDARVATFYSQSAGLTWFLLFYDHGKYRECFVDYLSTIYSGLDTPTTLEKITGTPYSQLDKEYVEYIRSIVQPEDAEAGVE